MRIIVLFPTVEEATAFLLTEPRVPVFVAGADPAEMAAATVRAIRAKKPHLAVLAGLAASCDDRVAPGETVEAIAARMAGSTQEYPATGPETGLKEVIACTFCQAEYGDGSRYAAEIFRKPEPAGTQAAPHAAADRATETDNGTERAGDNAYEGGDKGANRDAGQCTRSADESAVRTADQFAGCASADAHGTADQLAAKADDGAQLPLVADREGAAFLAVCEAMETACCMIRTVTHRLGQKPDATRRSAALHELSQTLNELLTQIDGHHE